MDEKRIERVKVHDFTTGETTTIPASELAAGMVRVQIEGSDEVVWVDSAQLNSGDYQHPPFDGELREKILHIQQSLAEVFPRSYEEWEDGFRRDHNVDQEIDLWIQVCHCLESFTRRHSLSADERREAFQVLVACLNGTPSTVLETVSLHVLKPEAAKQLADSYFFGDRGA